MKKIFLNNVEYEVINDCKDAVDVESIESLLTDYFDDYDYIVGDWAYGKLRLKGFYEESNEKVSKINNINNLDDYIKDKCAYGCKWFLIKKI